MYLVDCFADELQQLYKAGRISGFALLTPNSVASPVAGILQKEFCCDEKVLDRCSVTKYYTHDMHAPVD